MVQGEAIADHETPMVAHYNSVVRLCTVLYTVCGKRILLNERVTLLRTYGQIDRERKTNERKRDKFKSNVYEDEF